MATASLEAWLEVYSYARWMTVTGPEQVVQESRPFCKQFGRGDQTIPDIGLARD